MHKLNKVIIKTPTLKHMKEFILSTKNSINLHHPWVYPPDNEEKYFNYLNRINTEFNYGFFIINNENKKISGVININDIIKGCFQNAYLGYYAFQGFENQGLMSEGLELVLFYAFNNLKLHRLEANIQPTNKKSINFIKAKGFRHEGFSPNYLKINNKWKDHERFAMTAEDFLLLKSQKKDQLLR